jgi:hypothetical protein
MDQATLISNNAKFSTLQIWAPLIDGHEYGQVLFLIRGQSMSARSKSSTDESNGMSVLEEYSADSVIRGVCLESETFGKVW